MQNIEKLDRILRKTNPSKYSFWSNKLFFEKMKRFVGTVQG